MKKEKKKSKATTSAPEEPKIKEETSISWQAPEFEYHQKDVSWYWLSLMVMIILLALSIWQKNFLFAFFVIIAWLVIVYSSRRLPAVWIFKISETGIEIKLAKDNSTNIKSYPYGEIDGFDIHSKTISPASDGTPTTKPKYKELVLKLKSKFSSYLKINFLANDEEKIKNFLQKHIIQEEYKESVADSFFKLIKF